MRILFVNTAYPSPLQPLIIGGAEVFSQRLVNALIRKGHDVQVLRSGPAVKSWPTEVSNGVQIETLPILNFYHPWQNRSRNKVVRALWHLLDDWIVAESRAGHHMDLFRPDVVHTNNLSGIGVSIWKAAVKRRVPIVHTIHDYYLICPKTIRLRTGHSCASTCRDCRLLTARRRPASNLVSRVVSVSRRTLDIHRANGLFTKFGNRCDHQRAARDP